jgi:outer membrane protein OmpA-like peptidoglycan-associated protein
MHYLETHPEIDRIRIEGHTDSRGLASLNERISGQRALAVKTWLTSRAIPAKRVVAVGCGETRPLDTNRTAEGRDRNRRMTILIIKMNGKAFQGRSASGGCKVY